MKITVREDEPIIEAGNLDMLNAVIQSAAEEARAEGLLNIIFIESENGNYINLVVGSDETVLGFNYWHGDPPYYVSKGNTEDEEPMLTAYVSLQHHTEFPRMWVIPIEEGMLAVHEFFETGELPTCIQWSEV